MPTSHEERRAGFRREALVHLDALYGLGLRLTGGDASRAERLVRDTIVEAARVRDGRGPGIAVRPWLMARLRDRFLEVRRRGGGRPDPAVDGSGERPFVRHTDEADRRGDALDRLPDGALVSAIEGLEDELRVPLVLADVEGLTYEEIAEAVELPVEGATSRLFRARDRLRERLIGRTAGRSGERIPTDPRPAEIDENPSEITCREALEVAYEYLDGELDPETQERIHSHVESCQRCYVCLDLERRFLDAVRDRGLAAGDVDELRDRLRARLQAGG